MLVHCRCGGGKTHAIKHFLGEFFIANPDARVIVMSPNRAFAWWVTHELSDFNFKCYMEVDANPWCHNRLIISLESITKGFGPKDNTYGCGPKGDIYTQADLVIVDECRTIMTNFTGTMWEHRKVSPIRAIQTFIKLVEQAGKVLACDAYLESGANMVEFCRTVRPGTPLIISSGYTPQQRIVRHTNDPFVMAVRIEEDLRMGKKLLVPCASNAVLLRIVKYLVTRGVVRGKLVDSVYTEEGAAEGPVASLLVYNKHNPLPPESFDVGEVWGKVLDAAGGGAVIYSGTVQVGTSYNKPVDGVYVHVSPYDGTPPVPGMLQALHRGRKVTKVYACVESVKIKMKIPATQMPITAAAVQQATGNAAAVLRHGIHPFSIADAVLESDFGGGEGPGLKAVADAIVATIAEANRSNQDPMGELKTLAARDGLVFDDPDDYKVDHDSVEWQIWKQEKVKTDVILHKRNYLDIVKSEVACELMLEGIEASRKSEWINAGLRHRGDIFDAIYKTKGGPEIYGNMCKVYHAKKHGDGLSAGLEREFMRDRQEFNETRNSHADVALHATLAFEKLGLLDDPTAVFRDSDLRKERAWIEGFRTGAAKLVLRDTQKLNASGDRKSLINPIEALAKEAFGLELASQPAFKRPGPKGTKRPKISHYEYRFSFPGFPAEIWKVIVVGLPMYTNGSRRHLEGDRGRVC